ncbi:MAG: hypothetical protein ACLU0O_03845 [Collinsella sp.]
METPPAPLAYDVNVLEVTCDYLSIQLVGMASSLRSRRTAELGRSLNVLRDELFTFLDDSVAATQAVSSEICNMLNCHFCPVEYDASLDSYVIDFEGGSRVALPDDPEKLFFSTQRQRHVWGLALMALRHLFGRCECRGP